MTEKQKKKIFSSFDEKKAFKQLKITKLSRWNIEAQPVEQSEFFHQRLARLTSRFNLKYSSSQISVICCRRWMNLTNSPRRRAWFS